MTKRPRGKAKRAAVSKAEGLAFELRLQAALVDAAWSHRRPGLMLLLLEEMAAMIRELKSVAGEVPPVLPQDGLMMAQEIAQLAGVHVRTVQKSGPRVAAVRQSRRGGRPANLYAVDDVIPWLLERGTKDLWVVY